MPLPKLTPDAIRSGARRFKKRTGVAPDGWHPRHFAIMPDSVLNTLAGLYELVERTGWLPAQQRDGYVFLLDKATGGGATHWSFHIGLQTVVENPTGAGITMVGQV